VSHGRHVAKPGIDAIKVIRRRYQPATVRDHREHGSDRTAREAPDLREVGAALTDIISDVQRVSRMVGTCGAC
jgi:hypothetical protein